MADKFCACSNLFIKTQAIVHLNLFTHVGVESIQFLTRVHATEQSFA